MQPVSQIHNRHGKMLIFGGVYSNYQALCALKEIALEAGILPQNTICTGDILGYCAQPNECIEMIKDWGIHSIAGNVEINIRENMDDCGCNFSEGSRCDAFSANWYAYTQRVIDPAHKDWLHSLPHYIQFSYSGQDCFVLHGGYPDTSRFIFESTESLVKHMIMDQTQSNVILAGHCGLPFHTAMAEGLWINPGVIGMPANDASSRVWYAILSDKDGFSFEHHSFTYDHETTARLMLENKLPRSYAQTLATGLWDNMEILPSAEKLKQGQRIRLSDCYTT